MTIRFGNLMMRRDETRSHLPAELFDYNKLSILICSIKSCNGILSDPEIGFGKHIGVAISIKFFTIAIKIKQFFKIWH